MSEVSGRWTVPPHFPGPWSGGHLSEIERQGVRPPPDAGVGAQVVRSPDAKRDLVIERDQGVRRSSIGPDCSGRDRVTAREGDEQQTENQQAAYGFSSAVDVAAMKTGRLKATVQAAQPCAQSVGIPRNNNQ